MSGARGASRALPIAGAAPLVRAGAPSLLSCKPALTA